MTTSRRENANALRALAMDAVQQAQSGHPGMPMGMADIAEVLWRDHLRHSPKNPNWFDRDRFVLSNGHGSMLLYALLHLSGYDLPIEELKNFRQLHAKTPGHPEVGEAPGVETTTGPLGQGVANAVGMAMAEKVLADTFNRPDFDVVDHHTYAFVGDGCLMEGVSHEVCSLAGTLGLGKLIVLWDDNGISIDGQVVDWFADNTPERFHAYHWQVIENVDGHDAEAISAAISQAKENLTQPTLICCQTQIGYGSPNKVNTAGAHGAPLGEEELAMTKAALGWPHAPFEIPADVYQAWDASEKGRENERKWNERFAAYETAHPELAHEFLRRMHGDLPAAMQAHFDAMLVEALAENKKRATRQSSGQAIANLAAMLPELIGGSADLSGSNCTSWPAMVAWKPEAVAPNYIHYGVREFGMSAIMNGLALHKGFIPFGGTFLVFSDYARNAVRLSALMRQKVIYVYSHDSIGLGEDGPTHQPIEQASSLRLIPNLDVWRPACHVETVVAWQHALQHQGPSALLLTRQGVSVEMSLPQVKLAMRGAYILQEVENPVGILIATGSEVEIALQAAERLAALGQPMRVVSMPCREVFLRQDASYQAEVLPAHLQKRIAIEAGSTALWHQFVGLKGRVIGIDQFGLSAPYQQVYEALSVTVDAAVAAAKQMDADLSLA